MVSNSDSSSSSSNDYELFGMSRRELKLYSQGAVLIGFLLLIATNGVAAQQNNSTVSICSANQLIGIANAVIQISILGGVVGGFVTYYSTTMVETLPVGQDTVQTVREYRSTSMKALFKLIGVVSLGVVVAQFAGLPLVECVDWTPFI